MALKKEIVFNNGVKIQYHKINNIKFNDGVIYLEISCYTDETYRIKEKENKNNQEKYNELMNLILLENKKEEDNRNTDQIILWSNHANELALLFNDNLDLKVITLSKELNGVTDFNMSNLYLLLKEDELFVDSEDLL